MLVRSDQRPFRRILHQGLFHFRSGLSVEESQKLTEAESTTPAKDSKTPGKSDCKPEAQELGHTAEVSHKELRSRDVKPSVPVSHPEPEPFHAEPVTASHSPSDKTLASPDTKTASLAQEESTATAVKEKPLTSVVTNEDAQSSENKPDLPQPCQDTLGSTSEEKDTFETESGTADVTVSPTPTVTTESLKRKVSSEQEIGEKKPRISPLENLPQATASVTEHQRVPPLKVGVCLIRFAFILVDCQSFQH